MESGSKNIDLKIRCYRFSVSIIQFINSLDTRRIYFSILDQLLRAATSVGANIVEAKSASSRKDFIKYYEISLKSSNETKYWIWLLRDSLEIDKKKIESLLTEADEISKIIASSLLKLKGKK